MRMLIASEHERLFWSIVVPADGTTTDDPRNKTIDPLAIRKIGSGLRSYRDHTTFKIAMPKLAPPSSNIGGMSHIAMPAPARRSGARRFHRSRRDHWGCIDNPI
jgi:hypothetical protein